MVFMLMTLSIPTRSADAAVASVVGCYVGGKLSAAATKAIKDAQFNLIYNMKDGPLKDFTASLFGLGGLGSAVGVGAVPVSDAAVQQGLDTYIKEYTDKNFSQNVIAKCISHEILNSLISGTEKVVKTQGRDGGTTYVKNWTNFETNAQYRGENVFRAELSTAKLCTYLNDDVKKSYGVDPKKKTPVAGQNTRTNNLLPFSLQTNCTMPQGFTQQKYQEDFAGNGGWDAFARLLEPQNNALGLSILSGGEINRQRDLAVSADNNQVLANSGYLGVSGKNKADSCKVKAPNGDCIVYKDIKTTGSYLSQGLAAGLNTQYAWLTNENAVNNIISNIASALTQSLINKFENFSDPSQGTTGPIELPVDTPAPDPVSLAFPPPSDSLTRHPDQTGKVAAAKQALKASGADLSGPCGAFKIVAAAALSIGSGAGLLSKPGGNNCQGYSTDIIAYPDGYIYDVLGGAGDLPDPPGNAPGWSPVGCASLDCSDNIPKYRPAFDPGSGGSGGTPTSTPTPTSEPPQAPGQ